jgi:ribosomal protein S18 acetylase RimI-like enzyme
MRIIQANIEHLGALAKLFDAYRQFYKQEPDLIAATHFLKNNLENNESAIFLAQHNNQALGFVQLYPTWESISMSKRWVLYDLFVTPEGRGKSISRALMQQAKKLAVNSGAKFICLETAHDNVIGQTLYESEGYKRDLEFYSYQLDV